MEPKSNEEKLVHCIYTSAATLNFTTEDIVTLLQTARANNAKVDVSGMLLHDKGSFFQVLEGKPDNVLSLLEVIEADTRHDQVVRLIYEEIEQRDFSEWTMGFSAATRDELQNIEGLNDLFNSTAAYTGLDEGRAKILLKAFREGKWRSSIA